MSDIEQDIENGIKVITGSSTRKVLNVIEAGASAVENGIKAVKMFVPSTTKGPINNLENLVEGGASIVKNGINTFEKIIPEQAPAPSPPNNIVQTMISSQPAPAPGPPSVPAASSTVQTSESTS